MQTLVALTGGGERRDFTLAVFGFDSYRAQHPTDTSELGSGAPLSFPVTVRNVPPVVQSTTVADSLGHDLTAAGALSIIGLPVSLAVDFTDPGVADTQTATVDWGDGTTSTTFDSFTDANGGVVGELRATRTYVSAGAHVITTTVTDDDGGATVVSRTIQVLSLEDALSAVAEQLTALIGSAANGRTAAVGVRPVRQCVRQIPPGDRQGTQHGQVSRAVRADSGSAEPLPPYAGSTAL